MCGTDVCSTTAILLFESSNMRSNSPISLAPSMFTDANVDNSKQSIADNNTIYVYLKMIPTFNEQKIHYLLLFKAMPSIEYRKDIASFKLKNYPWLIIILHIRILLI